MGKVIVLPLGTSVVVGNKVYDSRLPTIETKKRTEDLPQDINVSSVKTNESTSCTLTNKQLVSAIKQLVIKLAKTAGEAWSMQVPSNANEDPDQLIFELCKRFERLSNE
jgi:hypothetical protein